jgi:hypothetical protein
MSIMIRWLFAWARRVRIFEFGWGEDGGVVGVASHLRRLWSSWMNGFGLLLDEDDMTK